MTREETKKLQQKYRDYVHQLEKSVTWADYEGLEFSVKSTHTPILMEEGAFVEATIWVPKNLVEG